MKVLFLRNWRSLALRGALALCFGVVAGLWPAMPLAALVLIFGGYAAVDGVLAIVIGEPHRPRERGWALVLEGLAGIGLGLAAFFWARSAVELVVLLIALWAIASGVLELSAAVRFRRELPGEVLLFIGGAASIVLGVAIFVAPNTRPAVLVSLLGSYAVVFGGAMLLQAARLRRQLHDIGGGDHGTGPAPHAA